MLKRNLKSIFGFNNFRKGQEEVIQLLLNNQSAIAQFPTGAGKSLCYQLPSTILSGMTLVISPLISLMKDQLDHLSNINIPAAKIDSTLSSNEISSILHDASMGKIKTLFISPERLKSEIFRYHLSSINISLMVIDEAHCISEWGHNFRPEYLKLSHYKKDLRINQVLLLTATATPNVISDMAESFNIPHSNIIKITDIRRNLILKVTHLNQREKSKYLVKKIQQSPNAPTIIYVSQIEMAKRLTFILESLNYNVAGYYSELGKKEKEKIQDQFLNGDISIIVATIAFGMGIDKQDIRYIYHYNMPSSPEAYIQETGRSGRDGKQALCELLYSPEDIKMLKSVLIKKVISKDAIKNLLSVIKENVQLELVLNITELSSELEISQTTISTILVYLERKGIIQYQRSLYKNYEVMLKTRNIQCFHNHEQALLNHLFNGNSTLSKWVNINIYELSKTTGMERLDTLSLLSNMNQKDIINIKGEQVIEFYSVLNLNLGFDDMADEIFSIFEEQANYKIKRLDLLGQIFNSGKCINKQIAKYFGNEIEDCGNCSACNANLHIAAM